MEFEETVNPKAVEYHKNAILIPSYINKDGKSIESAAYDKELSIIETSKSFVDYRSGSFLDKLEIEIDDNEIIQGKSIYIGKLTNNILQFYFDALSRVKSLMRLRSYDYAIFTLDHSMPLITNGEIYEPIKIFLEAFNIDSKKLILLNEPMKFASLRIPVNKVSEHNVPDQLSFERVVNRMTSFGFKAYPEIGTEWNSKVYISSRNKPNNKNVCLNENELEDYFSSIGYSILDPYNTPFSKQLAIYDNTKKLVTIDNEIVLNHIYCNKEKELTVISNGSDYSYEQKMLALNYQEEAILRYLSFDNLNHNEDGSFEYNMEDIKMGISSEPTIHVSRPTLNTDGINHFDILDKINKEQEADYIFCQIGNSQAQNRVSGASHIISPILKASSKQIGTKKEICFYQKNSAEFFESDAATVFSKKNIDVGFITGPKKPKKLMRDFLDMEEHCHQNSMIILPNILKDTKISDNENLLWKMVAKLKETRQDLKFTFINSNPSGLVIIEQLNSDYKKENPGEYTDLIKTVNRIKDENYSNYTDSITVAKATTFLADEQSV